MIDLAAENMRGWTRLHHATLALLAETNLAGLKQAITDEFPRIFDLDSAALIMTDDGQQTNPARYFSVRKAADIASALSQGNLYLGPPNDAANQVAGATSRQYCRDPASRSLARPCVRLCAGAWRQNRQQFWTGPWAAILLVFLAEMIGVALAARLDPGVAADD